MLTLPAVIRPAIPRARIARPAYSKRMPRAAGYTNVPDEREDEVLDLAAWPWIPSVRIRIALGCRCASTLGCPHATSLVPILKASAPKAMYVEGCFAP